MYKVHLPERQMVLQHCSKAKRRCDTVVYMQQQEGGKAQTQPEIAPALPDASHRASPRHGGKECKYTGVGAKSATALRMSGVCIHS